MVDKNKKMSGVHLNGVQLTEEQADILSDALHNWYENGRKVELNEELAKYKTEIEQMPEIFQVRIDALREVNPKEFATSPELVLSSLVASYLVRTLPQGFKEIERETYFAAHERYDLDCGGDVNPALVYEMVCAYRDDVKSGAIDKNGKVLDLAKSNVMTVYHNTAKYGRPCDARGVSARFKCQSPEPSKPNMVLFLTMSKRRRQR